MKQNSTFSLKDKIFNHNTVTSLAQRIHTVYPEFDQASFVTNSDQHFPQLQLKERIHFLAESLYQLLPKDYAVATRILIDSLPPELDPSLRDNDFGDFIYTCYSHYISLYGCTIERLELSFFSLAEMTKRFSAEFAIRTFINTFPSETLDFLNTCSISSNYHLRRLASEGTRPTLPWAESIHLTPEQTLPILHKLAADPARFVTRSVANHLNDLSKTNSDLVLNTLDLWRTENKNTPAELGYLTKHALRTLLKLGHKKTLAHLGYPTEPNISKLRFSLNTNNLSIGETLELNLELVSSQPENLIIHSILYLCDKNGAPTRRNVYQWKNITTKANQHLTLHKKHPLRLMTTRSLYPGPQIIAVQINGTEMSSRDFHLQF